LYVETEGGILRSEHAGITGKKRVQRGAMKTRKYTADYITTAEVASHFCVSEQFLRVAAKHLGCPHFRAGRVFRWRVDLMEEWIDAEAQKRRFKQAA